MLDWLVQTRRLKAAREALAREAPAVRRLRLSSRELYDAAQQLARADAGRESHGARATLHRRGALEALRALVSPDVALKAAELLEQATPEQLALTAEAVGELGPVRALLLSDEAELPPKDVGLLAVAHRRLLEAVEAKAAEVDRIVVQAVVGLGLVVIFFAVLGVVGLRVVARLSEPKDLAAGKPWRTSSSLAKCEPENELCSGVRTRILFHTLDEAQPWFEVDLGAPTAFSAATVVNRGELALERAVPLVLEAGDDQKTWRELARTTAVFSTWRPSFGTTTARYVRLRVDRFSTLHLEAVRVHP